MKEITIKQFKNDLLKSHKKALASFHSVKGFCFDKPYLVFETKENVTINKISKYIDLKKYDAALLIEIPYYCSYQKEFVLMDIVNKKFELPQTNRYTVYSAYGISFFYTKTHFEQCRKSSYKKYIIAQEKEYISYYVPKAFDFKNNRLKVIHMYQFSETNEFAYSAVAFLGNDRKNEIQLRYECSYKYKVKDIVDKSGYFRGALLDDLNERVRKYKEKVNFEKYLKFDKDPYLIQIENKKQELIAKVKEYSKNIETYDEVVRFSKSVSKLENFMWHLEYFNNASNNIKSIENFEKRVNNLLKLGE